MNTRSGRTELSGIVDCVYIHVGRRYVIGRVKGREGSGPFYRPVEEAKTK